AKKRGYRNSGDGLSDRRGEQRLCAIVDVVGIGDRDSRLDRPDRGIIGAADDCNVAKRSRCRLKKFGDRSDGDISYYCHNVVPFSIGSINETSVVIVSAAFRVVRWRRVLAAVASGRPVVFLASWVSTYWFLLGWFI